MYSICSHYQNYLYVKINDKHSSLSFALLLSLEMGLLPILRKWWAGCYLNAGCSGLEREGMNLEVEIHIRSAQTLAIKVFKAIIVSLKEIVSRSFNMTVWAI